MKKLFSVIFFFFFVGFFMGCSDLMWTHKPANIYSPTTPEEILVFKASRLPSQPYEIIGEIRYSKFLGSYESSLEIIKQRAASGGAQGIIVLDADRAVRWGAEEGLFHFGSSTIKASLIRFKKEAAQ